MTTTLCKVTCVHLLARRVRECATIALLLAHTFCGYTLAATPSLNTNLLQNPDAETGTTAGWVAPDRPWVADAEVTPHGGSKMFWPGNGSVANTTMYQDVDVSALASSIDAGGLYMHLSGWLENYNQYPHDRATLSLAALDGSGNSLDYRSAEHRSPTWTKYSIDRGIPAGTRTLRVSLNATRFVGTDDDGYFDDLSLIVSSALGSTINVSSVNSQAYVTVGGTLQLQAATTGATDSGYVWTSSFEAIASVDAAGLVKGVRSGRTTVQARGKDSGVIGTYDVTVIADSGLVFTAPGADASLVTGTTSQVTWTVIGEVASAVLALSTDGGVNYTAVATIDNPTSGSYAWTVPATAQDVRNAMLKITYSGNESLSPLFSIVAHAPAANNTTPTSSKSDCLFNWAEQTLPQYFVTGAKSETLPPYYFRHYPSSGNYLAVNANDEHLWVLGTASEGKLLDLGPTKFWLLPAGCNN